MKQRTQAICESIHSVAEHVDALREIVVDLNELGVPCLAVALAADDLHKWRKLTASSDYLISGPPAPNTAVGTPHECYNASIDPAVCREDPPCIACGAPESVCECGDPSEGDSTCEPPHAGMEPSGGSGRVFDRGAYLDWKGQMICCDTEPEPFAVDGQREPEYHCPKCSRMCLGNHLEDEEVWAAERAAGWDPNP